MLNVSTIYSSMQLSRASYAVISNCLKITIDLFFIIQMWYLLVTHIIIQDNIITSLYRIQSVNIFFLFCCFFFQRLNLFNWFNSQFCSVTRLKQIKKKYFMLEFEFINKYGYVSCVRFYSHIIHCPSNSLKSNTNENNWKKKYTQIETRATLATIFYITIRFR